MTEALGWVSSLVLVITIAKQVHRQWQTGTSKGVSVWLFVGQCAASIGFAVYSWLIHDWVFVVTNSLLALAAFAGIVIVRIHERRDERRVVCATRTSAELGASAR